MASEPTNRFPGHGDMRGDSHGQADGHDDGHDPRTMGATIEEVYDDFADRYEATAGMTKMRTLQHDVFNQFKHHGFTLDLGSGTGVVGMLIRQSALNSSSASSNGGPGGASMQPKVYVHGVDISTRMLNAPWCVRYYDSTQQGFIQDTLVDPNASWLQHAVETGAAKSYSLSGPVVDHITCFGALHFLNPTEFDAVLSRMFILARRSVMFDVDDLCPVYIQHVLKSVGEGFRHYNHMATYRKFETPPGWAKVMEEEAVLYHSPNVGVDVSGVYVRFERMD